MQYYLALDGGGTKTKVLCADQQGSIVGEGVSGPTNLTTTELGAAGFHLREAIRQALENLPAQPRIKTAVMGLAGADTPKEIDRAHQVFSQVIAHHRIESFKIINDIEIALASGTDNPNSMALISGTGSNCFGRNDQGQTAKTGGMDHLLTDQGSGYAIGRQTLREAVKSFDGRSPKTSLETAVCEHFRIKSIAELKNKVYNPLLSKTEVATLAKVCFTQHYAGDPQATRLLLEAVDRLFLMASTVLRRLNLEQAQVDCVVAGSIATDDYIETQLRTKLVTVCPQINLLQPIKPPVYGALKLAQT